jgi:hypothetical protein
MCEHIVVLQSQEQSSSFLHWPFFVRSAQEISFFHQKANDFFLAMQPAYDAE